MFDLAGMRAVVTGATRGIGWATAEALAAHGARVALTGVTSREAVESKAAELAGLHGVDTLGLHFDVSDAKGVDAAYRSVLRHFGGLDILVNNAGIVGDALIGMISAAAAERVIAVNLTGAILNLQAAARLIEREGTGSIVNISSVVGLQGHSGQAVYAASKAGLTGLTLSAAKELASKGIRVNLVAPGFTESEMIHGVDQSSLGDTLDRIPLGRWGRPEEIAMAVLFLVSPLAGYITGQTIGVDGGIVLD